MNNNFNYININPTNDYYLNLYWKYIIIIGIYYLTPSLQFILFQSDNFNIDCHYNKKCSHKYQNIHSFNNLISNIFYII